MRKLIFFLGDKHESMLQIDAMVLMVMVKHFQSLPKSKFVMSLQHLRKEVRDEVDFLHADKYQSFLQVDFNILGIKVSYKVVLSLLMGRIKHSQSTQSNKFAISLQYLKKKLGMEFIFCMQKNIKVSTSSHYRFRWKWLDMSKVPKIGNLQYFCNRKKRYCNCLCVLL